MSGGSARVAALASAAPDIVAVWRSIDEGALIAVRREVRRRAGPGTADGVATQLAAVADGLRDMVEALPERAFGLPGGEGDWNVAQALGHAADSRAGLAMAGALAAGGRWPADAPEVVPGIPGAADATREQLLRRLAVSQRIVERSARTIAGHETEPCPLVHPLVGRMRCGEWLLFAGVHDLMHLAQLAALEEALGASLRPDLVECWVFRVASPAGPADARTDADRLEILLIRRAPHRIFPGLWQCVTGGVEAGETVPAAAMREVREETGLGPDEIEAFYDLDQVAPFYDEGSDAVVVSAIFACRVRQGAEAHESWEHDGLRWVPAAEAPRLAIWPSYAESIRRVRDVLLEPGLEGWFRLDGEGHRIARRPTAETPPHG